MPDCKILIADDEKLAREAIKLQLRDIPALVILEATNGAEALERIVASAPDILFLDIQMPLLNGLEVLQKLPRNYNPSIIFVTAFDMYAVQAFDNNAVDYLLKPFTDERFARAFNKAYESWKQSAGAPDTENSSLGNRLEQVERQLQQLHGPSTLAVRDGSKIFVVRLEDIMYIESGGDYLSVVTADKKYLHKGSLSQLEEDLPDTRFVRIHKSTIVNVAYIKELHSHFNGDYAVVLTNKQELRLSRNYREKLIRILG